MFMKKREMAVAVKNAKERRERVLKFLQDGKSSNPQVIQLCERHAGAIEAYEAVLMAIQGSDFFLKIDAGQ